ncbi:sugar ABC transporter permease [Streptomyces sp. C11-1]|uniref:Sugar ABC transporter permease n=1 Tax=Streptomyces durocortorensis TaxID=2811104 RepID=A0ABY9VNR0_9ACTN|nr:sugar ABC transporter permease [Streptomyces durocortorensis]WNF25549.1 sugar ABC transporter permease [Streptomyces durocortorensis]
MTADSWAGRALAAVVDRVTATEAEVGERFPLYAEPGDGRWTTTGRGSWTGGFWAGLLWLRARCTRSEADRLAAARCTARLAPWVDTDTATRGLIFWYATAPAFDSEEAAALRGAAGRACLASYDPESGIVPWGAAFGGPRLLARADAVPGLVPLLAGAGGDGPAVAAAHLHRHLGLFLGEGPAGSVGRPKPAWQFDAATGWRPREDPAPGWSRGEAWMLLAVADARLRPDVAGRRPERLALAAEQLLARTEVLTGPVVPPDDVSRPQGAVDTSAAAITAVALLKLGRAGGPRAAVCAHRAVAILNRLVEAHLTGPDPGRPAGMLLDGCYDAAKGLAVRHELIWGDFFLALGLAALDGLVDITRV